MEKPIGKLREEY